AALAAGRGHRLDAGDGRELLFQGRRHRRGHGLRARAGQACADRDRRVVHGGQIAHRQLAVGHHPEDEDAGHDQGGHDRAADEETGEVHDAPARVLSLRALIWTLEPWRSRSWPSVTTRSPGLMSPLTTTRSPAVRSTFTGLVAAVVSAWMTKTRLPCWPDTTADAGTTGSPWSTYSRRRTFTNS